MLYAKFRRIELELSVGETAVRSGLQHAEVSVIENGRLVPTQAQLAKLARGLSVTPASALVEEVHLDQPQVSTTEQQVSA